MKKVNVLLSTVLLLSLAANAQCEKTDLRNATAADVIADVCEQNAKFDSLIVKYNEDKTIVGVLFVNEDGKGHKVQAFDIAAKKCIFSFIPSKTVKAIEFRDNNVIVLRYADMLGSKQAFNLGVCDKCKGTCRNCKKGRGSIAWKNTLFGILPN